MNAHEIIVTLEMENKIMTLDPISAEYFDPIFLTKENKKYYDAHKDAISILRDLQDIADGKIKKHSDKDLTIYNNKWLAEHRQEMSTLLPSIPIEWLKKWAKDNSNGEWSTEYRIVFNGILKDWEKDKNKYTLPLARKGEAKTLKVAKEDLAPVDPIMQVTFEQVMQFCKERNLTVVDERLLNSLLGRL